MTTLAEKLKARKLATTSSPSPGATPTVEVVEKSVLVETKVKVAEPTPEPVPVVATVIPPDAPGGDKVPEKAEGIMATLAKRRTAKTETPVKAAVAVDPPVVAPPVAVEYAEVLKNVEPEVKEMVESAHTAWESAGRPGPDVEPKTSAPVAAELSLFIDAYPEKAPFESLRALEDEIAARTPSLLEHLRKTSPKDVPEGTVDLGEVLFGRGYSTLSASFVLKPITGAWTVSTLGPASSKVLEVLLPKATFVVRGRR